MEPMTSRQRWLAMIEGRRPDRIPTDLWCTDEVLDRLRRDLSCPDNQSLYQRLRIDRPHHMVEPFHPMLRCKWPHHPDDPEANIWGVRLTAVDYGTGVYMETTHHPLAAATRVADIEAFRWPEVNDFDFASLEAEFAPADGTRMIQAGRYEPFLLACQMRGMEQALMDLAAEPAIIEAILDHIFAFYYAYNRRIFEAGKGRIDLFYLAEDLGQQKGPLFSLGTYRRFLKQGQIRMAALAREYGIHVLYHTDGAARVFLNDLVDDVGIEILNPIQWRCPGMEREGLVRDFGRRIVFHGAMDNQRTLPFGTVQDVIDEVKRNVEIFGGARWICAPCHRIQPNTPTSNIVAMYDAIHEFGKL